MFDAIAQRVHGVASYHALSSAIQKKQDALMHNTQVAQQSCHGLGINAADNNTKEPVVHADFPELAYYKRQQSEVNNFV